MYFKVIQTITMILYLIYPKNINYKACRKLSRLRIVFKTIYYFFCVENNNDLLIYTDSRLFNYIKIEGSKMCTLQ